MRTDFAGSGQHDIFNSDGTITPGLPAEERAPNAEASWRAYAEDYGDEGEAARAAFLNGFREAVRLAAAQLAEATALLERLRDTPLGRRYAWLKALRSEARAFLDRAPAQSAAPGVIDLGKALRDSLRQPAAPEPSAEKCLDLAEAFQKENEQLKDMLLTSHHANCLAMGNTLLSRAEAAEAKLAAVAEQRDLWARQCNMTSEREADLLQELAALRRLAFGAAQNDDGSYDDAYQTLDAIRAHLRTPGETPSDGGGNG